MSWVLGHRLNRTMSDEEKEEESNDESPVKRSLLSSFNVSKMIELVKERPALWCKSDPRYRNRLLKDKSWKEILKHFEPNCDALTSAEKQELITILMKKWCNVRDSYRKYMQCPMKTSRPYIYSDKLSFLKSVFNHDHRGPRTDTQKRASLMEKTEQQMEEMQDDDPQEEWINEVYVDMDEDDPIPQKSCTSFQNELTSPLKESDANDSTISVLVNLLQKEEDEDRSFFKSILPSVKELSPENKFEFRIQVLKVLKVLKKRDQIKSLVKSEIRHFSESD